MPTCLTTLLLQQDGQFLEYFVDKVFNHFGLNWKNHVEINNDLFRPTDIIVGQADPSKANTVLGWHHSVDVDGVISRMCDAVAINITKGDALLSHNTKKSKEHSK